MRLLTSIFILIFSLTACSSYRTPTVSSDPSKMSSDTLCFRYETTKKRKLGDEVARRRLDCAVILETDPLYTGR